VSLSQTTPPGIPDDLPGVTLALPSMEFLLGGPYCENENLRLIVGCDSNAHNTGWGSTNCNGRGESLHEFLNSMNLEILNRGNESTFCNASRQEVIDITLGSYGLLESITGWGVFCEPSLSDHRHILFTLWGSFPALLIRNPRGNNWGSFREGLRDKLARGPRDEHGRRGWIRARCSLDSAGP